MRNKCLCYFSEENKANIFNCSNSDSISLPQFVLRETNWLLMENSEVNTFFLTTNISNTIKYLNMHNSKVMSIPEEFLHQVNASTTLKWLDLSYNRLPAIPEKFKTLKNIEKVWLGGNPFNCDCKMVWMIEWLNNFKTPTGEHKIVDYEKLFCKSGKMKNLPIYVLNDVSMGCYPPKLSPSQKVLIGIGTGVAALIIAILCTVIVRNSRNIKFLFFFYCSWCNPFGLTEHNKAEKLDNMKYDAFLLYRYVNLRVKNIKDEKHSRLCGPFNLF